MGTIAQEILRKAHNAGQRPEIKNEVDAAEANQMGKNGSDKGSKAPEEIEKEQPEGKGSPQKDKRDLGDSSADAKKSSDQAEKK